MPRNSAEHAAVLLLDRGVWDAPYLVRGLPALVVVTSEREIVGPISLRPGIDRTLAVRSLEAVLEIIDPLPALSLFTGAV